jgi:hypothetical protein
VERRNSDAWQVRGAIRNSMAYTLGEAAKASGKSKTSIRRALDSGRISGAKNALGAWAIEPAELHRVFPRVERGSGDAAPEAARSVTAGGAGVTPVLEARLEAAERLIEELRGQCARWQQQAERLTLLLTDQRSRSEPAATPSGIAADGRFRRAWAALIGRA